MQNVVIGSLKSPSNEDLARLSTLSVLFGHLSGADGNVGLANAVLKVLVEAFHADRGFVQYFRPDSKELDSEVFLDSTGDNPSRQPFSFTSTWLENCLESGEPILVIDTDQVAPTQSVTMTGIRSVMLTPIKLKSQIIGVIYLDSLIRAGCFEQNDLKLFSLIGDLVAVTLDRNLKAETVQLQSQALDHAEAELEQAAAETIRRLSKAAEFRDGETSEHLTRVSAYCEAVSSRLGLSEDQVASIKVASLLHDVGKLGIPDSIMLKPGRFTDYERKVMQEHTLFGARILADSGNPVIELAASIALRHHEKWDGTGYPHGLAGEEIPLPARIVGIADVFDAVSSKRRYKDSYSLADSFSLLEKESGSHFDPAVVEAFLSIRTTIEQIWIKNQEAEEEPAESVNQLSPPPDLNLGQAKKVLEGASGVIARTDTINGEQRQSWSMAIHLLVDKLEEDSKPFLGQLQSLILSQALGSHHATEVSRLVEKIITFAESKADDPTLTHIVLVDSDPYQREVISTEATRRGMRVSEVSEPNQALHLIEQQVPDVIVLELADPGVDTVVAKLKADRPDLPILILTRDGDLSRRLSVSGLENCAFLHKPLPPAAVVDEIEQRLPGNDEDLSFTILALDDDPVVLKIVGRVLRKFGYRTFVSSDPNEFWSQLVEHTPDLVLLDLEMPVASGFEICKVLRSDVKYRHLPVIVLTGHQELSAYQSALEAGADDVLSKPLQPSRLLSRIESRLARNRAVQLSAARDPLTGLVHRHEALRMGGKMFASAVRHGQAFSVCALEIEAFDELVAQDGWQKSVGVLQEVAELLLRSSRPEDVISRCKEHTLLLLLPHAGRDVAEQRIASLNTKLKQHKGLLGNLSCVGTVSTFPGNGNDLKSLLAEVDVIYQRTR